MPQTFTQNHLLSLLYQELNAAQRISALEKVSSNWQAKEHYKELKEAYHALPKVYFSPSVKSIERILTYSKRNKITVHA